MIILRKLGSQEVCRVILSDPLIGISDEFNQVFSTFYVYTPGRIEIVHGGKVLTSPIDFEETGAREITFKNFRPKDLTLFSANYETCYYTDTTTNVQEGITNIPIDSSSVYIDFASPLPDSEYILTVSLENRIDTNSSVYPVLVRSKTIHGFIADFSGEIDSSNYYLNWKASYASIGPGGLNITELSEDTSPELSGNLNIGDHLVMLDSSPTGLDIYGCVIGYSGEASEMYVGGNSTGFACPLYIKDDGGWESACAASGIYHMPCMALALEEGYGEVKKIFWKGNIRNGLWNWIPGSKIYVSETEGLLTNFKPSDGSWIQVVGVAISPDTIRFNPDLTS